MIRDCAIVLLVQVSVCERKYNIIIIIIITIITGRGLEIIELGIKFNVNEETQVNIIFQALSRARMHTRGAES